MGGEIVVVYDLEVLDVRNEFRADEGVTSSVAFPSIRCNAREGGCCYRVEEYRCKWRANRKGRVSWWR